jgi:hypothetical protein
VCVHIEHNSSIRGYAILSFLEALVYSTRGQREIIRTITGLLAVLHNV